MNALFSQRLSDPKPAVRTVAAAILHSPGQVGQYLAMATASSVSRRGAFGSQEDTRSASFPPSLLPSRQAFRQAAACLGCGCMIYGARTNITDMADEPQ